MTRYRVMAYVTGVLLVVLVVVGVPLKHFWGHPGLAMIVGVVHGFAYPVYLVTSLDLGARCRWRIGKLLLIMLAGTIPFMSFVAERKVTADVQKRLAAASAG